MLKIQKPEDQTSVIFSVSGRIEAAHLLELQMLFDSELLPADMALDLEELRLVDRQAVRFLAACEARGIQLRHCPSYVREWIQTGSDTNHEPLS
jgi:hypothetical protein